MDLYHYEPIDLECPSIRLLRLIKGRDGPIQCELFNAWLYDEVIEYEALSYTWGGTIRPFDIEVDGKKLSVTQNLLLALEHLRYEYQDRILWIDAICINQENLKERGHQVQQMGSIYSQAEQVVIWLGVSRMGTDALMESLRFLHQEHIASGCEVWMHTDPHWAGLWTKIQPALQVRHYDLTALQRRGLETLVKHSWFKRVWILQEVANAKRAIVCCGSKCVAARFFALAPKILDVDVGSHARTVLDIMPGPSRDDSSSWWSQKRDLYTLLTKFRDSEASQQRDMIYALFDISSDQKQHGLRADYTIALREVVADVSTYLFGYAPTYKSVSEFLQNFAICNIEYFCKSVPHWNVSDATDFFDQRGHEMEITEKVIVNLALNTKYREEIMDILLDYCGDRVRSGEEQRYIQFINAGDHFITAEEMEYPFPSSDEISVTVVHMVLKILKRKNWITENVLEKIVDRWAFRQRPLTLLTLIQTEEFAQLRRIPSWIFTELARSSSVSTLEFWLAQSDFRATTTQETITITENTIQAAAQNIESGNEVIATLLHHPRVDLNLGTVLALTSTFRAPTITPLLKRRTGKTSIISIIILAAEENVQYGRRVEVDSTLCAIWDQVHYWVWSRSFSQRWEVPRAIFIIWRPFTGKYHVKRREKHKNTPIFIKPAFPDDSTSDW